MKACFGINSYRCKKLPVRLRDEYFFRSTLGRALRRLLNHARVENRLVSGLIPALNFMQKNTEDVLFCLMPHASSGDAATHMQTVLLQAFCYENCIPVIEVSFS